MSRNYTRSEQRRYKEERQKQADRVADRLMGKKKTVWAEHDDHIAALNYETMYRTYGGVLRSNIYIGGITT